MQAGPQCHFSQACHTAPEPVPVLLPAPCPLPHLCLQVTAPLSEMPGRLGSQQKWRTSLHAQGALAVEGEAWIWRGAAGGSKEGSKEVAKEGSTPAAAGQAPEPPAAKQLQAGASIEENGGDPVAAAEEPPKSRLARAMDSAAAAEADPLVPRRQGGGRKRGSSGDAAGADAEDRHEGGAGSQPADPALAAPPKDASSKDVGSGEHGSAAAGSGGAVAERQLTATSLEQFMRPLEHLGEQMSDMLHHVTHPGAQQQAQQGAGSEQPAAGQQQGAQPPLWGTSSANMGPPSSSSSSPPLLLGLSSQSITSAIQDSATLLKQVGTPGHRAGMHALHHAAHLRSRRATLLCAPGLAPPAAGEGERGAADQQRAGRLAAAAESAVGRHARGAFAPPPIQHAAGAGVCAGVDGRGGRLCKVVWGVCGVRARCSQCAAFMALGCLPHCGVVLIVSRRASWEVHETALLQCKQKTYCKRGCMLQVPTRVHAPQPTLPPAAAPEAQRRAGMPGAHAAARAALLLPPQRLAGAARPPRWCRRRPRRVAGPPGRAWLHPQPRVARLALVPPGRGVAAVPEVRRGAAAGPAMIAAGCWQGPSSAGVAPCARPSCRTWGGQRLAACRPARLVAQWACLAPAKPACPWMPADPAPAHPPCTSSNRQGHRPARVCLCRRVGPAGPLLPPLPGLHGGVCARGRGADLPPRGGRDAGRLQPGGGGGRRRAPARQAPRVCA